MAEAHMEPPICSAVLAGLVSVLAMPKRAFCAGWPTAQQAKATQFIRRGQHLAF
jgi:hypothetical protein